MLPHNLKLVSSAEFSRVMKRGSKAGSRTMVVHAYHQQTESQSSPVTTGGPRFGLVVSKAVGNAVVRHRTARRLRHIALRLSTELPRGTAVVLRALPPAGTADSAQLEKDLRKALARALKKDSSGG
ncbi:ribonuclease P protein component [Corynebacterium doosanense]|uniref:Ribonuclease P protein component n=1 Tax=Corynebacterium doosanense CAU 212 = DSM 45436 TaxID=558173 RepID=A0A097IJ17_9CORY|nr:ribonuclease P protein component [Corynebacterium doosanense]AIT62120.1 ribonuclease P [Corynebacterium doosanense CAU 212 = DSM 45436]